MGLEVTVVSVTPAIDVSVFEIDLLACKTEGLEATEVSVTSAADSVSVIASLSCIMGRDATEVSMALFSSGSSAKIYIQNKQKFLKIYSWR